MRPARALPYRLDAHGASRSPTARSGSSSAIPAERPPSFKSVRATARMCREPTPSSRTSTSRIPGTSPRSEPPSTISRCTVPTVSTAHSRAASPAGTERTSLSRPSTTRKPAASRWKSRIGLRRSPESASSTGTRRRAPLVLGPGESESKSWSLTRARRLVRPDDHGRWRRAIRVPPRRPPRKRRGQHQRSDPGGPCVRRETGMGNQVRL